ncbi:hypothetical protein [Oceanirhabdus seepicola]|uniref:Spore coat protein n=1 Tax=Oceanirhabdus seepicola TaxID=2828781 RepID=A0A9J6P019_9CLOT|nr:hypothetical protein [Oceanirhabdus seepicola]MCM1990026.1 hypothetical protein [Oceanirhabdus seepicola]
MERLINFKEYIIRRGVLVTEFHMVNMNEVDEKFNEVKIARDDVHKFIFSLNEFHRKAMGYDNYMIEKLPNRTGMLFEQYKILYRKVYRYIEKLRKNGAKDCCQEMIVQEGVNILKRANKALEHNVIDNYLSILKRSMERVEICIGHSKFGNIIGNYPVMVLDISQCGYDIVETDMIKFIVRLKRKNIVMDWNNVIDEFIECEELDENSRMYIQSCVSYPYEFMRNCLRYFQGKKDWSPERYRDKLQKAIIQDGDSII